MLTLLHTSPVHVATFNALRDRLAPGTALTHIVHEDLLSRAMTEGVTPEIAAETTALIQDANGPVLCTCTTLGMVAEQAGAIRIDRPMMRVAAQCGGPVLMAYSLDSTADPSLHLLHEEMTRAKNPHAIQPLALPDAWPLFQSGDTAGFANMVAGTIRSALPPGTGCVVLAQASMAGAAAQLADLGVPVLSSPAPALKRALGISD